MKTQTHKDADTSKKGKKNPKKLKTIKECANVLIVIEIHNQLHNYVTILTSNYIVGKGYVVVTWAVSSPLGSYRLQPPSPFIIITQPEN